MPVSMRPCKKVPGCRPSGCGRSAWMVPVRVLLSTPGLTARTVPDTDLPSRVVSAMRSPGFTLANSASANSARHSSRPWRIRRSSSEPDETTCPGCTSRFEMIPSSGARRSAKLRRSAAVSRIARAVPTRASPCVRPARSSSSCVALMYLSLTSNSPRASCERANDAPASASRNDALACARSASRLR